MPKLLGEIHLGEDYPIHIEYYDESDALIAPDGSPTNSTSPTEPALTILDPAGNALGGVDGVQMPESSAGVYEYTWDSDTNADGTGLYTVEIRADFNSETDIERTKVRVD